MSRRRSYTKFPTDPLRKDGEDRPLLGVSEIAIGSDMILILDVRGDGIPTRRWTSPVIMFEKLA